MRKPASLTMKRRVPGTVHRRRGGPLPPVDAQLPPLAYGPGEKIPLVGTYLKVRRTIVDPIGLAVESQRRFGDVFTLHVPFTFKLTYLTGRDGYRAVLGLPPDRGTIEPILGQLPTVGFWFRRLRTDTKSLQELALAGRKLMAGLVSGPRLAQLDEVLTGVLRSRLSTWDNRTVDLASEIPSLLYEAGGRFVCGNTFWDEAGGELAGLYWRIADGITVPRAALAATPAGRFMPEFRATRRLEQVLTTLIRSERHRHNSLIRAIRSVTVAGSAISEADVPWMLMYVLFNVTTYPGSYGIWTLIDVVSHPDVLALARARSGSDQRRAFLADCLDETIRIYPVGLLARGLTKPLLYESAGRRYFVPAGHVVAALPYAINRNESEYHDAERYAPQSRQHERPAALFGRGAFGCVAASFTRALISGMLDMLLTEFELDLCDPVPARHCRVALPYPSRPLRAVARLRAGSRG